MRSTTFQAIGTPRAEAQLQRKAFTCAQVYSKAKLLHIVFVVIAFTAQLIAFFQFISMAQLRADCFQLPSCLTPGPAGLGFLGRFLLRAQGFVARRRVFFLIAV